MVHSKYCVHVTKWETGEKSVHKMCTKLEVKSVRELKVNSKFLPQTVAPGLFSYNAEGGGGWTSC